MPYNIPEQFSDLPQRAYEELINPSFYGSEGEDMYYWLCYPRNVDYPFDFVRECEEYYNGGVSQKYNILFPMR